MYSPTQSYYAAPSRISSRRPLLFGIGGLVLGVVLTLAAQLLLAPRIATLAAGTGNGDVSISIDDSFVTHQAARGVALAHLPFSVSDVTAHINAGNVISIAGTAATGPLSEQFSASTQVGISGGRFVSHLTSAQVGSVQLPGTVTALLDQAIDTQLDGAVAKLLPTSSGLVLSGINTSSGQLTLVIAQQ